MASLFVSFMPPSDEDTSRAHLRMSLASLSVDPFDRVVRALDTFTLTPSIVLTAIVLLPAPVR
jgi:hypothetical protein